MDDAVFGSECGLANIRVPLFHSVTDYVGFCGCIHHSVESVVVEGRADTVAIMSTEVPAPSYVGIVVYENTTASRTNWGVILVKLTVKVLPG